MSASKTKSFDVRTIDRLIANGSIKESEYKDFIKTLPDDKDNAEWVQLELDNSELTPEPSDDDPESSASNSGEVPNDEQP